MTSSDTPDPPDSLPPIAGTDRDELLPHILAVVGNLHPVSGTRTVVLRAAEILRSQGCSIDVLDLSVEALSLFNPDCSYAHPGYPTLKVRVERADVLVLGTPDYHGCMSGALKNFLDHFWKEFAGRLFVPVVGSFEKGLTVAEQIRTVARQCYAWSLPYAVTFSDKEDLIDGEVSSDALKQRLRIMARDARVYGGLLAKQRRQDLAGSEACFMARYRPAL